MDWLLWFAQVRLGSLTRGRWFDFCVELDCFVYVRPFATSFNFGGLSFPTMETSTEQTPDSPLNHLKRLQAYIRRRLDQLLQGKEVRFPPVSVAFHVVKKSDKEGLSQTVLKVFAKSAFDLFLYQAAMLFVQHGTRIRQCSECSQIFLGYRGPQQFCSPRCQNRATHRRYRERHKASTRASKAIRSSRGTTLKGQRKRKGAKP